MTDKGKAHDSHLNVEEDTEEEKIESKGGRRRRQQRQQRLKDWHCQTSRSCMLTVLMLRYWEKHTQQTVE